MANSKNAGELYNISKATVSEHLKKIYDDELEENATVRNFRTVQKEGSREVERERKYYNLQAIIAVGYKVNSERAVQFRKWAIQIVETFAKQIALGDSWVYSCGVDC